jgi:hypothetical protein
MIQKYKNTKTIVDGIKFDSKLESRAYEILRDNQIQVKLQPSFELQAKYKHGKESIRAIIYKADFLVTINGIEYIIDIKGMETPVFKLKKKILLYKYPEINFLTIKTLKQLNNFLCLHTQT